MMRAIAAKGLPFRYQAGSRSRPGIGEAGELLG